MPGKAHCDIARICDRAFRSNALIAKGTIALVFSLDRLQVTVVVGYGDNWLAHRFGKFEEAEEGGAYRNHLDSILYGKPAIVFVHIRFLHNQLVRIAFNEDGSTGKEKPQRVIAGNFAEEPRGIIGKAFEFACFAFIDPDQPI